MVESLDRSVEAMQWPTEATSDQVNYIQAETRDLFTRVVQVAVDLRQVSNQSPQPSELIHLSRSIAAVEASLRNIIPASGVISASDWQHIEQSICGVAHDASIAITSPCKGSVATHALPESDDDANAAKLETDRTPTSPCHACEHLVGDLDVLLAEMRNRQEETEDLFNKFRDEKNGRIEKLEASITRLMDQSIEFDEQNKTELRYLRNKVSVLEKRVIAKDSHESSLTHFTSKSDPVSSHATSMTPGHQHQSPRTEPGSVWETIAHATETIGVPPRSTSLLPNAWKIAGIVGKQLDSGERLSSGHDNLSSSSREFSDPFMRFSRSAAYIEESLDERRDRRRHEFNQAVGLR